MAWMEMHRRIYHPTCGRAYSVRRFFGQRLPVPRFLPWSKSGFPHWIGRVARIARAIAVLSIFGAMIPHAILSAAENPWEALSPDWGGHLRGQLLSAWPPSDSLDHRVEGGAWIDAAAELRLKNRLFFGDWGTLETHYELLTTRGETRENRRTPARKLAVGGTGGDSRFPLFSGASGVLTDDRRFLDLSQTLGDGDEWVVSHRLDRLALSIRTEKDQSIRIGRQALTWGNGLLFNPLDLFNPFAPTDVIRDYKVGDDMALVRSPLGETGELQAVYAPRRNPVDGDVSWEESALGARYHFSRGENEFDLLAGWNHENRVIGAGVTGYLGGAAWRADLSHTWLPSGSGRDGHWSGVLNLDYSWVAWGRNAYGFLEFFHGGLGDDDYAEAIIDPDLVDALARGERFILGRNYLAGQVQWEVHPLLNLFVTAIQNLDDPSGVVQPRFVWSMTQRLDLLAGANLYWGGADSEYGGFSIPGLPREIAPASGVYGWITGYF